MNPVTCDIYFSGSRPCGGGVLCVDGRTGGEVWRVYTRHEVFALNCQLDLDHDDVTDCLAAGRAGVSTYKSLAVLTDI